MQILYHITFRIKIDLSFHRVGRMRFAHLPLLALNSGLNQKQNSCHVLPKNANHRKGEGPREVIILPVGHPSLKREHKLCIFKEINGTRKYLLTRLSPMAPKTMTAIEPRNAALENWKFINQ